MKIKSLSYTGTGAALDVTGHGSTPDFALVKSRTTVSAFFKTATMPFLKSCTLRENAAQVTNRIQYFGGDGIRLGTDSGVNGSSTVYDSLMITGRDFGFMHCGVEVGTGSGHDVTLPWNYAPAVVLGKADNTESGVWRVKTNSSGKCMVFFAGAAPTTEITAFGSGTFTVGAGAKSNTSGAALHYVAFADNPDLVYCGSHTGTGSAQTISLPWLPALIMIGAEVSITGGPAMWTSSMTGGISSSVAGNATDSDAITAVSATGMTLGTNIKVNQLGTTYFFFALRDTGVTDRSPVTRARTAVS